MDMTDPADRQRMVEAYRRGDKIADIEKEFDVPRATVYWVLEKEGQTPNRIQRGRRLVGDDQLVKQLYDLIEAQDRTIRQLQEQIAAFGGGQKVDHEI